MAAKFVRAPSSPVLIAGGIALLMLAALGAARGAANHDQTPVVLLAAGQITKYAVLGAALLFVVLRGSQHAGAIAVIVATVLTFSVALAGTTSLAFKSAHVSWWAAIDLAIAATILWPSIFPWSHSANKPVFYWMALTFGAITLLMGILAIVARL